MNEQAQKLAVYLAFGVFLIYIFYVISSSVGYEPQAMKDTATWFYDNTMLLTIAFCFVFTLYVILKIKKRNDYSPGG